MLVVAFTFSDILVKRSEEWQPCWDIECTYCLRSLPHVTTCRRFCASIAGKDDLYNPRSRSSVSLDSCSRRGHSNGYYHSACTNFDVIRIKECDTDVPMISFHRRGSAWFWLLLRVHWRYPRCISVSKRAPGASTKSFREAAKGVIINLAKCIFG